MVYNFILGSHDTVIIIVSCISLVVSPLAR